MGGWGERGACMVWVSISGEWFGCCGVLTFRFHFIQYFCVLCFVYV